MRGDKKKLFVVTLNITLFMCLIFLSVVFFIITIEDKKDNIDVDFYSIKENKKTMFKNELPKIQKEEILKSEMDIQEDDFKAEDPELTYAIKLFESSVNEKLKTLFKKPFNYKEDSYCIIEVLMESNFYKIKSCNSDSIFKREIDIALNKMIPFNRKTYNEINLNSKKTIIKLKID